ncbi:hypothetical protein GRX03_00535 [Halovenus sp. WSH3]|uniref:C2H2-type domain-containing protein n=1 Tax=Halovenus carboxidivorans TaxID=2692199 RepID=A0A6B0T1J1_9EURY|nr:hypothetical protein [Halovenus carboxidivorans]MXR50096.1 hypothetical protein [Halovenus carboxidivorans]
MPECDYCADSFSDEDAYLRHLAEEHEGELTRIDQRRVASMRGGSDSGPSNATIGLAGLSVVMLLAVGLTGYLIVGGSGEGPTDQGAVHEHGTMEITIDGQRLDLTSAEFAGADGAFHFHGNEQQEYGAAVWHKHARGVTLQYALGTLGVEVNDDGTELTYDGTTYSEDNPNTSIDIEVDGEAVEPGTHEVAGVADESAAANGEGQDIVVNVTTG